MTNVQNIVFSSSRCYTLGVEIEFQIVDQNSYALVPLAPKLKSLAPDVLKSRISRELINAILEIQTGICRNVQDVENDLLRTCSLAEELAADSGCLLYAASLHPFARADKQERSKDSRYQEILHELQFIGRRFISQGLHVHVGIADGDSAVRVCNTLQGVLPVFLALSASSPYFEGEDTGLMSYRTKLFESLPLAGVYEYYQGWEHFVSEVESLIGYGIIGGVKDLWWDARPSPQFGTIEVRICDLPTRFSDILALVALIQAAVAWIVEDLNSTSRFNPTILRANKWQALRYGLRGRFVDPAGILADKPVSIEKAAGILLSRVLGHAADLGSLRYLNHVNDIVSKGTGTDRQRRVYEETGDLKEVVRINQKDFWQ
ncbi:MAG: YbdK family carboxylate-amine ligase [Desulfocapsaceae bacterium]|jgi:carboxylate-amine ligase|nr:YbdK family carboxylate-amine ligase [Desulfocapsaceae bacterium]